MARYYRFYNTERFFLNYIIHEDFDLNTFWFCSVNRNNTYLRYNKED